MTRADVLELLPLYAGGDLEPARAAAVEAAVALDPTLAAQLGELDALDDLLREHLVADEERIPTETEAAASEPAQVGLPAAPGAFERDLPPRAADALAGAAASAPLVRRQCPFCHDHLGAEPATFCGTCATPHHEACFAENTGCALLGCGGTTSIRVGGDASRVCELCRRHTPAGAPFCAWCGEHARRPSRPRHELLSRRPRRHPVRTAPPSRRPFLVAAATLLALGLGLGAGLGWVQSTLLGPYPRIRPAAPPGPDGDRLQRLLGDLVALQRAHWKAHGVYADDLERLLGDPVSSQVDLERIMDMNSRYAFEFEAAADSEGLTVTATPRWLKKGERRWTAAWAPPGRPSPSSSHSHPPAPAPVAVPERQPRGSK